MKQPPLSISCLLHNTLLTFSGYNFRFFYLCQKFFNLNSQPYTDIDREEIIKLSIMYIKIYIQINYIFLKFHRIPTLNTFRI